MGLHLKRFCSSGAMAKKPLYPTNKVLRASFIFLGALELLGPPVRQEGFGLRPPRDFRMARMDLFHLSRVGAVAKSDDSPRRLLAALVDTDSEDASSLMLSVIDEPFKAT